MQTSCNTTGRVTDPETNNENREREKANMSIVDMIRSTNMSEVSTTSRSKYFEEGTYLLRMAKCEESGRSGAQKYIFLRAEVVAVESQHPKAPSVGQEGVQMFLASGDYAMSDVMKFLTGATGTAKEALSDAQWKQIALNVLTADAMVGHYVFLQTVTTQQKQDPSKSFTHHSWGVATPERWAQFGLQVPV